MRVVWLYLLAFLSLPLFTNPILCEEHNDFTCVEKNPLDLEQQEPLLTMATANKLPTVFVSHGGGPCFFMSAEESSIPQMARGSEAMKSLQRLPKQLGAEKPTAIVIISGHWESDKVLIGAKERYTKLYYDYGGFPRHTYEIEYKAPGDPNLAKEIQGLLQSKGIPAELDFNRDWDHGVFVPLKVSYPDADIPIVEMSILRNYDPKTHIEIGKALEPLRERGVLIVGSGFATHNFRPPGLKIQQQFIDAVTETAVGTEGKEREKGFLEWAKLPGARAAHPREDHWIPFLVVVGAALNDKGKLMYREDLDMGFIFAHWSFQ
eukprot:TRINITY_DN1213_c0_g1_i1.p1 TRINITY_DN1213_c0_g1~~TRINITY_DN1213_c0_g1_i1.p1  ORF type:complete len:320 (-),score=63.87 TRINITY_DN1213_c0_g1_i1:138-1097(-)